MAATVIIHTLDGGTEAWRHATLQSDTAGKCCSWTQSSQSFLCSLIKEGIDNKLHHPSSL